MAWLLWFLSYVISKNSSFLLQKILNLFLLHFISVFITSKSVSQTFKILFQTVFLSVFLVDIFNKKAPSLTKKTSAVKCKTRFVLLTRLNATPVVTLSFNPSHPKRSYRKLRWQNTKGKFHHWQKLELCKFIHIAKLHKKC